ncbi:hypothetical protein A3D79_02480 [Candidatus Daviesbacteria bacterium RIFCSPHIGHO2_02_FULL_39_8]|nr:MAG: hypothetical protein A3D79_02480 [Candidatus Daviesbacteria bacterium RIFCSPHIGHO2_02_FULL_39_8]
MVFPQVVVLGQAPQLVAQVVGAQEPHKYIPSQSLFAEALHVYVVLTVAPGAEQGLVSQLS